VNLQPIVEGQGDVAATPVLLRRLADAAEAWQLKIARPHRRKRSELVQKDSLQRAIAVARLTPDCGAILVLFDADDDCPKDLAPALAGWAAEAAAPIPSAIVMANREYEAWLLAAIESLRGFRGIRNDAPGHPNPESPRDAKGELESRMHAGAGYLPTADQAAMTARIELASAYRSCRSFRKLAGAFGSFLAASGFQPAQWPPAAWQAGQ
jgi:hypothetical protein